jgi:hypothetical protein
MRCRLAELQDGRIHRAKVTAECNASAGASTVKWRVLPGKSDSDGSCDLTSAGLQERGDRRVSKRRKQGAAFEARIALEAVQGERRLSELAAGNGMQPPAVVSFNAIQTDQRVWAITQVSRKPVQASGKRSRERGSHDQGRLSAIRPSIRALGTQHVERRARLTARPTGRRCPDPPCPHFTPFGSADGLALSRPSARPSKGRAPSVCSSSRRCRSRSSGPDVPRRRSSRW